MQAKKAEEEEEDESFFPSQNPNGTLHLAYVNQPSDGPAPKKKTEDLISIEIEWWVSAKKNKSTKKNLFIIFVFFRCLYSPGSPSNRFTVTDNYRDIYSATYH